MMSTVEVSERCLHQNVRVIREVLEEAARFDGAVGRAPELLGVVKANGYGHGAELCAPMLVRAGVRWLGVTDAAEGVEVRRSLRGGGQQAEILLMSGPQGDEVGARETTETAVREGLTPVIWTVEQLRRVVEAASAGGGSVQPVHLEVDTGMSRQGAQPGRGLDEVLEAFRGERRVMLDGVFTHLASAECADGRQTMEQVGLFREAVLRVGKMGFRPKWVHVGNASTIDNGAPAVAGTIAMLGEIAESVGAKAMVRCGLALYGICLPVEGGGGVSRVQGELRPAMTWKTTVTAVMEVEAGARVGYGATFTASRAMRLALLPVGYADGLRRSLSSTSERAGGWVRIGGRRAGIVGRVSMNLTTVDVTGFEPEVLAGDEVILLGEGVTAEDHAELAGTIPYEILCGIRGRLLAGREAPVAGGRSYR